MASETPDFWKTGSYRQPLDVAIRDAVEQWRADQAASCAWHPRMSAIIDDLESTFSTEKPFSECDVWEIVEKCAEGALSIVDDPCACSGELRDALDFVNSAANADLFGIAEEVLQGKLAARFGVEARCAAKRALDLGTSLFSRLCGLDLPRPVRDYLLLAGRSYVSGFHADCMGWCRSSLESMLRKTVSYDMCEKHLGPLTRGRGKYAFGDRLHVARLEGLLGQELVEVAQSIWERGNKVLHEDPRLTEKVEVTVNETARVVRTLATGQDPLGPFLPSVFREIFGE